ncbi:hypothetical protein V8G54_010689 [Vigna mungo]|uniref:Uncharacterized protein n=1 Tax=Vigna mungo TaxID=3915 RepID=A0AAQ3NZM3_VIGMU
MDIGPSHAAIGPILILVLHTQLMDTGPSHAAIGPILVLVLHTQLMDTDPSHAAIGPISVHVLHTQLMDILVHVLHTQLMDITRYRSFTHSYWTVDKSRPPHAVSDQSPLLRMDLRVKLRLGAPTEYYTQHKLEPYRRDILPFLPSRKRKGRHSNPHTAFLRQQNLL